MYGYGLHYRELIKNGEEKRWGIVKDGRNRNYKSSCEILFAVQTKRIREMSREASDVTYCFAEVVWPREEIVDIQHVSPPGFRAFTSNLLMEAVGQYTLSEVRLQQGPDADVGHEGRSKTPPTVEVEHEPAGGATESFTFKLLQCHVRHKEATVVQNEGVGEKRWLNDSVNQRQWHRGRFPTLTEWP